MNRFRVEVPARRVVDAYRKLFSGHGSLEDAQFVTKDLEGQCGVWLVTAPDASIEETKFAEGQRSVFARIRALAWMSDADLEQIEAAERNNKELIE